MCLVELNSHPGGWPGLSSYLLFPAPCAAGRSSSPRPGTEAKNIPNPGAVTLRSAEWVELLRGAGSRVRFSPELGPGYGRSGPRSLFWPPGKMWLRAPAGSEGRPQAGEAERQEDMALSWVAVKTGRVPPSGRRKQKRPSTPAHASAGPEIYPELTTPPTVHALFSSPSPPPSSPPYNPSCSLLSTDPACSSPPCSQGDSKRTTCLKLPTALIPPTKPPQVLLESRTSFLLQLLIPCALPPPPATRALAAFVLPGLRAPSPPHLCPCPSLCLAHPLLGSRPCFSSFRSQHKAASWKSPLTPVRAPQAVSICLFLCPGRIALNIASLPSG